MGTIKFCWNEYKKKKRKRYFEKLKKIQNELNHYAWDILHSDNFDKSKNNMQHGTISVKEHSLQVARQSVIISELLGIEHSRRDLVRGALLHDYFLYDWHDKEHVQIHNLHGFYHPGIALRNASAEYRLTPRERDIIKKHMWPLTVVPPMCREAWIVTVADKWCSTLETLRLRHGHGAIRYLAVNNEDC